MNNLISRQAAIDALDERCESECEYSKKQRSVMCNACYLGSAKEVIEELPTIDPVKHGKWQLHEYPDGYYHTECSECGEVYDEKVYFWKAAHYCPNCGTLMEKSEDGET